MNCAVSCDGTWKRRGFSSLNGCVATISMDTGKILDVEPLSKFATHAMNLTRKHKHLKQHLERLIASQNASLISKDLHLESNKLRYSEFYGDGHSKSYAAVKDAYKEDNITVVKKECVGHVQKRDRRKRSFDGCHDYMTSYKTTMGCYSK